MKAFARQGSALACLVLSACVTSAQAETDQLDDQDSTAYAYPVVITPTRLRQPITDVPGSVTILTGEMLRSQGVRSVADALRMVPGMAVTQSTGNDFRINYHGTNVVAPRRMNVLIDGFAVYGATLSRVYWGSLPVTIEDVDRIEVSRGPDSASYGPNSMMAVVNIITRSPRDLDKNQVSLGAGAHHSADFEARLSRKLGEQTHIMLAAQTERDSGYDQSTVVGGAHDSSLTRRLNARSHSDLDAATSLDLYGSFVESMREVANASDQGAISYPDLKQQDSKLAGKWTRAINDRHELQIRALVSSTDVKQAWQSCWPRILLHPTVVAIVNAHPEIGGAVAHGANMLTILSTSNLSVAERTAVLTAIAQLGGVPAATQAVCGETNNDFNELRTQIELQDTYVVSDQLRVVGGAGLRQQQVYSRVYLDGQVNNMVRWLFGHAEYRATPALTFNGGGYVESNSMSGNSFSPRLAANYRLSERQTVRAVYSRGTRSPDALESHGAWSPVLDNLSQPVVGQTSAATVVVLRGDPKLHPERNTSIELGHVLALAEWGMVVDTRVFHDRLTDLITNYSTYTQISPNNDTSLKLAGLETQANWTLSRDWSGWLGYGYLVNYAASNVVEHTQWSRHSGSLGVSHTFDDRWQGALSTYWSSGDGQAETRYGRTDVNLNYRFRLDQHPTSAQLTLSYLHSPLATTYISSRGEFVSSYNSRLGLFGRLRISF